MEFSIQAPIIARLYSFINFLRPRKLSLRKDRRSTKKEYRNRRHKYGYYYKWLGS